MRMLNLSLVTCEIAHSMSHYGLDKQGFILGCGPTQPLDEWVQVILFP